MKAFVGLLLLAGIVFLIRFVRRKKSFGTQTSSEKVCPAAQPVAPEPREAAPKNAENIKVAGVSHHFDSVQSFGKKNPAFAYTKAQILKNGLANREIPEWTFPVLPAQFVFEPENEFDPNAIAILVSGVKIGYVKKGSTSHIRNLINSGRIVSANCTIRSGGYKLYCEETEELETWTAEPSAKVSLELKP